MDETKTSLSDRLMDILLRCRKTIHALAEVNSERVKERGRRKLKKLKLFGLADALSDLGAGFEPRNEVTGLIEIGVNPTSGNIYWYSEPLIVHANFSGSAGKYENYWHLYVGFTPWDLRWTCRDLNDLNWNDLQDPFLEITFPSNEYISFCRGGSWNHRFDKPAKAVIDTDIIYFAEVVHAAALDVSRCVWSRLSCQRRQSCSAPYLLQTNMFFPDLAFVIPRQTFAYMPTVRLSIHWI